MTCGIEDRKSLKSTSHPPSVLAKSQATDRNLAYPHLPYVVRVLNQVKIRRPRTKTVAAEDSITRPMGIRSVIPA